MKKHRSRFGPSPKKPTRNPKAHSAPPPVALHRPLPAPPVEQDVAFAHLPAWLLAALRGPWSIPDCNRTFSATNDDLLGVYDAMLALNPVAGPRLGRAVYEAVAVTNFMLGIPSEDLPMPNNEVVLGEYVRRFLWLPLPLSALLQAGNACEPSLERLLNIHNHAVLLGEPIPEMRALTLKGTHQQMRGAQDLLPSEQFVKANPDKPQEDLWLLGLSPAVFSCEALPKSL